jgi:hypothetical protein
MIISIVIPKKNNVFQDKSTLELPLKFPAEKGCFLRGSLMKDIFLEVTITLPAGVRDSCGASFHHCPSRLIPH